MDIYSSYGEAAETLGDRAADLISGTFLEETLLGDALSRVVSDEFEPVSVCPRMRELMRNKAGATR